jgi:hypothetical protein
MAEYADLSLEDDVFMYYEKPKKDSSVWITKDGKVDKIKNLETGHLQNIDEFFKTLFKRLIRIKIELVKRKLGFNK